MEVPEAGPPADGDVPATVASQRSLPVTAQASMAVAGLPAARPEGGPSAGRGRGVSANQTVPGLAPGLAARSADAGVPPVILPSAAAGAPRSEAAPVVVADGEQQHAIPAGKASIDVEVPAPAPSPAPAAASDVELPAEPATTEPAAPVADLPEVLPDEVALAPVVEAEEPVASPVVRSEKGASAVESTAEVVVAASTEPVSSSTRSTPVRATEPAAPPSAEAFTADLANTVRRATLLGDQEVRLLLNPPELGRLDIRIVESPEGLRVILEATTAEARELIEQQLPMLRNALEARDLRVERIAVEQALEASSTDTESDRGLRQDGEGNGGSEQSGEDAAWSPVAALQSDESGQPTGAAPGSSESESESRMAASDGRLDVLA